MLNFSDAEYPVIRNTGSVKARAEVLRELKKARQEGTYVVEP
ncbi:hypothetical protein L504_4093 [Bordetella bronchiseptica F2]|uniref:Uncharacterized protein n=1 Tax=Bordetella bronchiseptica 00-P-2796 TaxID=1331199 RepID=A0ABR4RA04_BORBO|nr:hypothetical protein L490_5353 [Bordetella bronchiseptica 00-P-2796]KDC13751.1 hypothetical protein L542_4090 [Bordetella bronchiseptica F-1]KDC29765.1 hypothetical protein L504_4093 [Bordetella bronchiseptica F2]KDD61988.1 hypothetical protein L533_5587 [Bordetella bronchiseptica OSU553]